MTSPSTTLRIAVWAYCMTGKRLKEKSDRFQPAHIGCLTWFVSGPGKDQAYDPSSGMEFTEQ